MKKTVLLSAIALILLCLFSFSAYAEEKASAEISVEIEGGGTAVIIPEVNCPMPEVSSIEVPNGMTEHLNIFFSEPGNYTYTVKVDKKEGIYYSPEYYVANITAAYDGNGSLYTITVLSKDDSGTYQVADGDTLNSGRVRANESPKMYIHNKRGWGLRVNKKWSDKDFTTEHGSIYTAVYIGNNLVPGTVKRLAHPNTQLSYFFDDLQSGTTFSDYKVYEVEVNNPILDSNGNVLSYGGIRKRIEDDGETTISAIIMNSNSFSDYSYYVNYNQGEATATASSASELGNIRTDTITNTRTYGVVLTLYDMNTHEPLANGTFTLTYGNDTIGTYTSDSNGQITIFYDFDHDADYTLTQTSAPSGYLGLPNSAVFSIALDDEVTISGNDDNWEDGYKAVNAPDNRIVAYIDLFNKPFTFSAVKVDSNTGDPLSGAHFSLYRSVTGVGGPVKDVSPIPGYEDLVTDASGVIPGIDNTLTEDKYYLTEVTAPSGYDLFDEDIIFSVSSLGDVTIESEGHGELMRVIEGETSDTYTLRVPNSYKTASLTVTKTVEGAFCDRTKEFTFTLTVDGAEPTDEYSWSKNGTVQENKLRSGGTFTLKHNDTVVIDLPKEVDITITESNQDYISEFTLGEGQPESVNTKTFEFTDDETLAVTNTLDGVVPTGVNLNITATIITAFVSFVLLMIVIVRRRQKYY